MFTGSKSIMAVANLFYHRTQAVPTASNVLHFSISGQSEIIATGNANQTGMAIMQQPKHKAFEGKCLVMCVAKMQEESN